MLKEEIDYITPFIKCLDSIIPKDCKDDFDNNLKTLKLSLNFNSIRDNFSNVEEITNISGMPLALYSINTNEISIDKRYLKYLYKNNNNSNMIWNNINASFFHELTHMASSNYNKGIYQCGFGTYVKKENMKRALTEGMTEFITLTSLPQGNFITNYFTECCFISQLINILGKDILLKSYFKEHNTKLLEESLQCLNEKINAQKLFTLIEKNYQKKGIYTQKIESHLISYFNKKLEKDIKCGKDVTNLINKFEITVSGINNTICINNFNEVKVKYLK